jgi:peptide/nickel transport system ATP-binding protein
LLTSIRRAYRGPEVVVTPDRSGPVASVRDLHLTFHRSGRDVHALRGVTLDVAPGEILGLVGESGSGKSVLGLALLGLLPDRPAPEVSGSALVCGTDMVAADADTRRLVRRRYLGSVFQDPMTSLNPTMRVGRQVAEAAGSMEEAARLLDAVGVPDAKRRLNSYPHELSGGLRQRVMIAMAVAGEPALVIADEPTTALDVTVQAQILELLVELRGRFNTSFVLVTHDLGVAAQVADRIAVLYGGRLAELGPAEDVFRRPRHPYSAGLLRSRLLLDSDRDRPVVTLPGEPPDPRNPPSGCPFSARCAHHAEVCDEAVPAMVDVEGEPGRSTACVRLAEVGVAVVTAAPAAPWSDIATSSTHPGPVVIVRDVHKDFELGRGRHSKTLHALRGVNLEVNEGESVALVGESGCGKSTLLRSIAGLQPITSGFIDLARGERPQMVFQDAGASLTPWLSVGEMIGERLKEESLDRQGRQRRVADALRLVGLPAEVAGARSSQLSGGQRQRVALARATVVPPQVLLCDEPTSALDVSLAATVLNLIGRLRRELGISVLFVTHDLAAARVVADRIAVMYLGRIVEVGPAADICHTPIHPYARALLSTVPGVTGIRVRLKGEPASPLDPPSGCEFHPRCPCAEPACSTAVPALTAVGGHHDRWAACPVMAPPTTGTSATPGTAATTEASATTGTSD